MYLACYLLPEARGGRARIPRMVTWALPRSSSGGRLAAPRPRRARRRSPWSGAQVSAPSPPNGAHALSLLRHRRRGAALPPAPRLGAVAARGAPRSGAGGTNREAAGPGRGTGGRGWAGGRGGRHLGEGEAEAAPAASGSEEGQG